MHVNNITLIAHSIVLNTKSRSHRCTVPSGQCGTRVASLALEYANDDHMEAVSRYFSDDVFRDRLGLNGANLEREADEATMAESNFLLRLIHVLDEKLPTCTKRCLICDTDIPVEGVRPGVCPLPMCIFSYGEMGVGVNLSAEIRTAPEVAVLLLSFLYACARGGRLRLLFPHSVCFVDGALSTSIVDDKHVVEVLETLNKLGDGKKMLELAHRGQEHLITTLSQARTL